MKKTMFHAYAIVHPDEEIRNLQVKKILTDGKIHRYDVFTTLVDTPVTIADVRQIQRFLSRTALTRGGKAAVISGSEITLEGQHALLKTLEEPPPHSIIILCTINKDLLLPTILSRAVAIEPEILHKIMNNSAEVSDWWNKLLSETPGTRLEYSSQLAKDKDTLDNWLSFQLTFLREELQVNYTLQSKKLKLSMLELAFLIRELFFARKYLAGNISSKLLLDRVLISVPFVSQAK